jgi:UV excision repair protein RAD23
MAEQAEATFLRNFVWMIANQPVNYPDDFQAPPEQALKKILVAPVCFLAPWTRLTSVLLISPHSLVGSPS